MNENGPYKVGTKYRINAQGTFLLDIGIECDGVMKNPMSIDMLKSEEVIKADIEKHIKFYQEQCDMLNCHVAHANKILAKLGIEQDEIV